MKRKGVMIGLLVSLPCKHKQLHYSTKVSEGMGGSDRVQSFFIGKRGKGFFPPPPIDMCIGLSKQFRYCFLC